jgi:hypothetical protein
MVHEAREQVVADEDLALAMPEPPPERARRWLHAGDPPHGGAALPARYADWTGVFGD